VFSYFVVDDDNNDAELATKLLRRRSGLIVREAAARNISYTRNESVVIMASEDEMNIHLQRPWAVERPRGVEKFCIGSCADILNINFSSLAPRWREACGIQYRSVNDSIEYDAVLR
jgi:hypothetical protein